MNMSAALLRNLMSRVSLRRTIVALLVPAAAVATLAMPASSASASGATTYGFACSSTNHWVRQNWPNITTNTATNENVWFATDLYIYTTSGWQFYRSSGWMGGVSNYAGRKALGYFGGTPYYFLYGTTKNIAPQTGWVFSNLPAGYAYKTAEFYQTASGASWSNWSSVQGNPASTYCIG